MKDDEGELWKWCHVQKVTTYIPHHILMLSTELAWAQVKGHIKAKDKQLHITDTEQLSWDEFAVVTPDSRKKIIRQMKEGWGTLLVLQWTVWAAHHTLVHNSVQRKWRRSNGGASVMEEPQKKETCTADSNDCTCEEEIICGGDCTKSNSPSTTACTKATMALMKPQWL